MGKKKTHCIFLEYILFYFILFYFSGLESVISVEVSKLDLISDFLLQLLPEFNEI